MIVGAKHSRNNVDEAVEMPSGTLRDRIKTRMQRRPDRLEAGDRLRDAARSPSAAQLRTFNSDPTLGKSAVKSFKENQYQ
jgi:hypothetical protein